MVGIVPPSSMCSAPVIAEARSETRNATSSAMSWGCAGRVVEGHFSLDRGDVDDRSSPGLDHGGDQAAIEAYRSEKVEMQGVVPYLWGERREPAGRGGCAAAGDVDDDVRAAVGGDLLDH